MVVRPSSPHTPSPPADGRCFVCLLELELLSHLLSGVAFALLL